MATSDLIARFILDAIDSADGFAELQRAALAEMFSCVPSQINYVISTRFSPERGYVVESRRGGGGYIRIRRVHRSPEERVMHMLNSVGGELDYGTARAFVSNLLETGMIDKQTARVMLSAVGSAALYPVPADFRDAARASIFKQMLVNLIAE